MRNYRCKGCKEPYPADHEWLMTRMGRFHSFICILDFSEKKRHEKQKQQYRANDLKHQLELLQGKFNALIRALDASLPCISCGDTYTRTRLTAGHYRTVKAMPALRFYPMNCHGQCSGCNSGQQKFKKGDSSTTIQKFRNNILARYGQEALDWLEGPHEAEKFTCGELAQMRAIINKEITRLGKGGIPSRDWRAIRDWRGILK